MLSQSMIVEWISGTFPIVFFSFTLGICLKLNNGCVVSFPVTHLRHALACLIPLHTFAFIWTVNLSTEILTVRWINTDG
ncbi:hypothetical protein K443DRAFT_153009 [Laccaria amethystina LaAM-08-1]|uniref:Uncharacterized protein n=1 Tax=Laccaria amethystina LaAM-08-1 TaxID=1095629 RepID=A0A0C9Y1V0_9AGAR|nr:hypothetical protein K443DRAFT_153009 [Laccaria amethystina LaAM-08-1]